MRKIAFFVAVMILSYHAFVFELLLDQFSPLPVSVVWLLSLVLSWWAGRELEHFSKTLLVLTVSFIIAGVLSYVLIGYYMKETIQFVVQTLTMKAVSVSLLVFFTSSIMAAFLGFMFKPRQ
ncbi:MAG: hypothetical protein ACPLTP_00315 [Thermotoga caldifontis]|uniref:hypothetical protein n=1 Tax=Thermotoga caldifontis TaxID=1508419 RepID=UPI003C7C6975